MTLWVLDASAVLAYLQNELGSETVERALYQGVSMTSVNWAEVLTRVVDSSGRDAREIAEELRNRGLAGSLIQVVPFTEDDALVAAGLRLATQPFGLSLADRACLALGLRLGEPIMTTDRVWANLSVGVAITVIR